MRSGWARKNASLACGGEIGEIFARQRRVFGLGHARFRRSQQMCREGAVEHPVARRFCRAGRAVGPARLGRLRQRDEQRRLAVTEAARLLAEIGQRGGAQAFEIAAIGRQRQIQVEDLAFGKTPLQFISAENLPRLGQKCALGARLQQTRRLHGQGRASGHGVAVADKLPCGAQQRGKIDAVVAVEMLVLIGFEQSEKTRIDVARAHRQPPASIRRLEGAQKLAVAVERHV